MLPEPRRDNLYWFILGSLALGAAAGLALNVWRGAIDDSLSQLVGRPVEAVAFVVETIARPIGQIFLNLLLMTVVPLVFASLSA